MVVRYIKNIETQIDEEDAAFLDKYTWHWAGKGYLQGYVDGTVKYFAREIMNAAQVAKDVDHINRDTTDNRKENLRIVSHRANLANAKRGKSGYNWVYPSGSKWQIQMRINGKAYYFGTYEELEVAAGVADSIASTLFEHELERWCYNFYPCEVLDETEIHPIYLQRVFSLQT